MKNKYNLSIFIIGMLYVLPIVLANVYYVDDMGRLSLGYGWDGDGRILSNIITEALSFGNGIISTFPYSTLLSSAILVFAGAIVAEMLFENKYLRNISSLFIVTSPFMLENLSYRYDSILMAISVLFAVIPFIFRFNYKLFFATSVICLLISFCLYQTSTMAYFSVTLCLLIKQCLNKEKAFDLRLCINCLTCFFASYIVYSLLINILAVNMQRSGFIPFNSDGIDIILSRINSYKNYYSALYVSGFKYVIWPCIILSALSFINFILNGGGIGRLFLLVIYLFCSAVLTMMPNLVISTAWVTPRTFICFPFLIISLFIIIDNIKTPLFADKIKIASSVLLVSYSFFLCSIYGATLKNNDDYSDFIAQSVSNVIMKDSNEATYKVMISGYRPFSVKTRVAFNTIPFINILAPNYMSQGSSWGIADLSRYIDMAFIPDWQKYIDDRCNWITIDSGSVYHILKKDNLYIVDFDYRSCK
ncbi:TPA: glucosyltransferase domain-containing protein [Citrobacter freundii]